MSADRASHRKGLAWLVAAILLGWGLAFGLPLAARHLPWSVENRLAEAVGDFPGNEPCRRGGNTPGEAALARLVARLRLVYPDDSDYPIRIDVVRGSEVNAFASLGGRIFIYEAMIRETRAPEELAAILAHEIEHVRRRHVMQGMFTQLLTSLGFAFLVSGSGGFDARVAELLLGLHYTRTQEAEADAGALARLRDARIDVGGFVAFFERAATLPAAVALLSDHPSNQSRAGMASQYRGGAASPILSDAEWGALRGICEDAEGSAQKD